MENEKYITIEELKEEKNSKRQSEKRKEMSRLQKLAPSVLLPNKHYIFCEAK